VIAVGASSVCSVESTNAPESAAFSVADEVAHLADGDDVGVAAEDRAQRGVERDLRVRVDLDLVGALEPVLDRVLDRDEVEVGPSDVRERGVDRRRLARAGGAGDEQRPAPLVHEPLERELELRQQADLRQRRRAPGALEQPQRGALAGDRRHRRHADVEDAVGLDLQLEPALLRAAALADVESRLHLDPRDRGGGAVGRQRAERAQRAVDADPQRQAGLAGHEVEVGRTRAGGPPQRDQLGLRRLEVGRADGREHGSAPARLPERAEDVRDGRARRDHELHRGLRRLAHLVARRRVGDRDGEDVAVEADGDCHRGLGDRGGEQVDGVRLDRLAVEVEPRQPGPGGQGARAGDLDAAHGGDRHAQASPCSAASRNGWVCLSAAVLSRAATRACRSSGLKGLET